jgi:hypothetical protein
MVRSGSGESRSSYLRVYGHEPVATERGKILYVVSNPNSQSGYLNGNVQA